MPWRKSDGLPNTEREATGERKCQRCFRSRCSWSLYICKNDPHQKHQFWKRMMLLPKQKISQDWYIDTTHKKNMERHFTYTLCNERSICLYVSIKFITWKQSHCPSVLLGEVKHKLFSVNALLQMRRSLLCKHLCLQRFLLGSNQSVFVGSGSVIWNWLYAKMKK